MSGPEGFGFRTALVGTRFQILIILAAKIEQALLTFCCKIQNVVVLICKGGVWRERDFRA